MDKDKEQKKIVLIDDDESLRFMYLARLTQAGFNVMEARGGEEGIALVKKEKPDIVLLDIMMPEMSGFDVLHVLKSARDKAINQIPVILLTNLAEDSGHKRAISMGAAGYVMKVDRTPDQLVQLIHAILKTP